jgi:hypothetical protein
LRKAKIGEWGKCAAQNLKVIYFLKKGRTKRGINNGESNRSGRKLGDVKGRKELGEKTFTRVDGNLGEFVGRKLANEWG